MATEKLRSLPPSMAWLTVFLPVLSYYIATRISATRLWGQSSLGVITDSTLRGDNCSVLESIFYTKDCDASPITLLRRPLYLILQDGLQDVNAMVWKHDSELGRGYLLLSQAHGKGRIWRWEVGGGPIPIGKTLHIEDSGCRSNHWKICNDGSLEKAGSAGLTVDFMGKDHASEGRLVVAELGEARIVRMEENGARTPLIVEVPHLCSTVNGNHVHRRLEQPGSLLYTPFGDLLVTENHQSCARGGILRLRHAMYVDPLSSTFESRQAHFWNTTLNHDEKVEVLYQDGMERVGAAALDENWTGLYVTAVDQNQSVLLLHLSLISDKDDGEENEEKTAMADSTKDMSHRGLLDGTARVVYNFTRHCVSSEMAAPKDPGALTVDQKGHVLVGFPDGILVLDGKGTLLATLILPQTPTSLALGEDDFLYISTRNQLYRIQAKAGPIKMPTNMVVKPTKKKKSHNA